MWKQEADTDPVVEAYVLFCYETPVSTFYEIVDIDTGEMIGSFRQDDLDFVTKEGFETIDGWFSLRFQTLENGSRHCFVVDQLSKKRIDCGWLKPEKKEYKRGGRKSYAKIALDKFSDFPDSEIAGIYRLSSFLKTDGSLRSKNGRFLSEKSLIKALTHGETCGFDVLEGLKEKGVIKEQDGKFYVDKKYTSRG